jgi:hypothetical protein
MTMWKLPKKLKKIDMQVINFNVLNMFNIWSDGQLRLTKSNFPNHPKEI